MAFLPGIFGKPQQQQPQGQQQPQNSQQPNNVQHPTQVQQNPQSQNQGATNPNGSGGPARSQQNGPANGQMDVNGNPSNPLDPFLKLMTPPKEVVDQQTEQQRQSTAGLFGDGFTPEAIGTHLKNTNFAAGVAPELMERALGGDANAMIEAMNSVAQAAVSTAIQSSKGMVEHGVKTGNERFSGSLDSRIRSFQLNNQNASNPALQHPVGKALLKTVTSQIASANPRMSAEEAHTKGVEMFEQFASMLAAKPEDQNQKQKSAGPNWLSFIDDADLQSGT